MKCLHAQKKQCKKNSQILHAQQFFPSLFGMHLCHHTAGILVRVLNIPIKKLHTNFKILYAWSFLLQLNK